VRDSLRKEINNFTHKKYLKYSNEKKNSQFYHTQLYDKSMNTIIRNKDINRGLLDMINKGLIPRNSDVTPAFNRDGNPLCVTSKNFNKFRKTFNKSDVTNALHNQFRYRPEYNFEIFYKTFQPKFKKLEVNKNSLKREKLIERKTYNENNKNNLFDKKDFSLKNEDIDTFTETINATPNDTENKNKLQIPSNNAFNKKKSMDIINKESKK
jgi:hypothetical protein